MPKLTFRFSLRRIHMSRPRMPRITITGMMSPSAHSPAVATAREKSSRGLSIRRRFAAPHLPTLVLRSKCSSITPSQVGSLMSVNSRPRVWTFARIEYCTMHFAH
ncbi:hypothetical protein BD324DRAFT_678454, partial [Kockovaella imperatae]